MPDNRRRLVRTFRLLLFLTFVGAASFQFGCTRQDIRGWFTKSDDGKTYLVVEDSDGPNCPPIWVDGRKWPVGVGEKAEISSGTHKINCGNEATSDSGVGFEVVEGTIFHFDYWGP
jgi:P pilus assembly chaperone PapD